MYVYVCIYICICMYMYVCICMYLYVYVCICMYMYVYVCICMYVCMYIMCVDEIYSDQLLYFVDSPGGVGLTAWEDCCSYEDYSIISRTGVSVYV